MRCTRERICTRPNEQRVLAGAQVANSLPAIRDFTRAFRDACIARYLTTVRTVAGTASIRVEDSKGARTTGVSIPVREASCAMVTFTMTAPEGAELVVEHQCSGRLLARECRPLAAGARALEIKTHLEASHIVCSLKVGDQSIDGVRFDVDCGERIEPTGRNFIVIGAMKAGTTTLFHLLAQHSAICRTYAELPGASNSKEINYFQKLYRKGDTALHYDWRFPFDPARHAWTLDISTNYAKLPIGEAVPRRIAALGGETKLAYILREPVDRIESNHAHTLRKTGKMPNLNTCIQTSSYAQQMDRFTVHIPRDNILLLDFHQLQRDPAAVLAQICDFLGIDRFVAHTVVHNRRGVDFRLDAAQRAELADVLRPDVRRLINRYNFKPAKEWLQRPS